MKITSQSFEETNYDQGVTSQYNVPSRNDHRFLDCPDKIEEDHPFVSCGICRINITGIRFKCIDCPDYDLCGICEINNRHSEHLLIRFIDPVHTNVRNLFINFWQLIKN